MIRSSTALNCAGTAKWAHMRLGQDWQHLLAARSSKESLVSSNRSVVLAGPRSVLSAAVSRRCRPSISAPRRSALQWRGPGCVRMAKRGGTGLSGRRLALGRGNALRAARRVVRTERARPVSLRPYKQTPSDIRRQLYRTRAGRSSARLSSHEPYQITRPRATRRRRLRGGVPMSRKIKTSGLPEGLYGGHVR